MRPGKSQVVIFGSLLVRAAGAWAEPEPDINASGCVDLRDVAGFMVTYAAVDLPGLPPCDFWVDGTCNLHDYQILATVLRGPICECAVDQECSTLFPCTIDDCYSGACRHVVDCPNQNDTDADCVREECGHDGCQLSPEPEASPCDDGIFCTIDSCNYRGECTVHEFIHSLCPDQDDSDANCIRQDCMSTGCVPAPEPQGSPCDDGIFCTIDSCNYRGECTVHEFIHSLCPDQDDSDANCIKYLCFEEGCVPWPEPTNLPCDDGRPCTVDDVCSYRGSCIPGESTCQNQDDGDSDCQREDCTHSGCQPADEPDGSSCEDGITCTSSDICLSGQCVAGIVVDSACPNQDFCDSDCVQYYCDPAQGCVQGIEFEMAPCRSFFCDFKGLYSACNASGTCDCRPQPPPSFGCPP